MTNRQGYKALKAALERLAKTRISTNIVTDGQEIFETFGSIARAKIVLETRDGRGCRKWRLHFPTGRSTRSNTTKC